MKSDRFKPFKAAILALFLAHALSACSQSPPDYSGTTPIRMYRNSSTDIITLKVPNGYLDHFVLYGPPIPGTKEDTAEIKDHMFFTAEAGTLKPRSAENNQAFVHPNSLTEEFYFNIGSWRNRSEQERPMHLQELYKSFVNIYLSSCRKPPEPKQRFGLDWYTIDVSNCPTHVHRGPQDMLIDRDANGDVTTLLRCTSLDVPDWADRFTQPREFTYNPKCQHRYYFKALNASVTLRYSRFYVKDWRLLEERINALLLSFVQTPSNP